MEKSSLQSSLERACVETLKLRSCECVINSHRFETACVETHTH